MCSIVFFVFLFGVWGMAYPDDSIARDGPVVLNPHISIRSFIGSDEVTTLVPCKEASLKDGMFFGGEKAGGLILYSSSGIVKQYSLEDGCRFVSVLKIVSTTKGTAVLGKNGNLQFYNSNGDCFSAPCLSKVEGFAMSDGHCFAIQSGQLLVSESEGSSFSSIGTVPSGSFISCGDSGSVLIRQGKDVFEVTKRANRFLMKKSLFLSRSQIISLSYNGLRGVINHGFGYFSYYLDGDWYGFNISELEGYTVSAYLTENGLVLFSTDCFWVLPWDKLQEGRIPVKNDFEVVRLPEPSQIEALVSTENGFYFVRDHNRLCFYDQTKKSLDDVCKVPLNDVMSKINALAVNSGTIAIGTSEGGFLGDKKNRNLLRIVPREGSIGGITSIAPISPVKVALSDMDSICIFDTKRGVTAGVVNEPAFSIYSTRKNELYAVNSARFTLWDLKTTRLLGKVSLGDDDVRWCNFFDGLLYFSTQKEVFRLSVHGLLQPSVLWNVTPLFYDTVSRRWKREQVSAMTTDAYGVVVGTTTGQVRRIAKFQGRMGRVNYVQNPDSRRIPTALANRGNTLFCSFKGRDGGIYRTTAHGGNGQWIQVGNPQTAGLTYVRQILLLDKWLAARTGEAVLLVDLRTGVQIVLDGRYGTYGASVQSMGALGNSLYIGGDGLSIVKLGTLDYE